MKYWPDGIMIEKSRLADIKDLLDRMMMELRFRGLGDEHGLVREAFITGRWIDKKLRGTE